ncbi:hypothetical protein BV25DRAFT_1836662 [Artomyces pyxidatus]|uniref:Uncharacterized protein n=1 Tax=Artomyces pyxidatus TaxID=48021 RepID=A0ACB8T7Q6_9AGAM|nr:hypothetical protein BV25DRAFT_1836662 [Artomyces pyxidatus]
MPAVDQHIRFSSSSFYGTRQGMRTAQLSAPLDAMNARSFDQGSRVLFWTADGSMMSGTVERTISQGDGYATVVIRVDGGKETATFPYDPPFFIQHELTNFTDPELTFSFQSVSLRGMSDGSSVKRGLRIAIEHVQTTGTPSARGENQLRESALCDDSPTSIVVDSVLSYFDRFAGHTSQASLQRKVWGSSQVTHGTADGDESKRHCWNVKDTSHNISKMPQNWRN